MRDLNVAKSNSLQIFGSSELSSSTESINKKSQPQKSIEMEKDYNFKLFAKPLVAPKNSNDLSSQTQSYCQDGIHNSIQNTWSSFNGMSDSQRNQMIKGILGRCSSKQIEYICTLLNLKMIGDNSINNIKKIVPAEVVSKFPKNRGKLPLSKPTIPPISHTRKHSPNDLHHKHVNSEGSGEVTENEGYLNSNMYIKLLNSKIDPDVIPKQIMHAGPQAIGFVVGFLSTRCKKLQSMLECMHDIAIEVDVVRCMSLLLNCILESTESEQASIYIADTKLGNFIVRSSTWQKENQNVTVNRIFGSISLAKGETVNVYNIKTSEYYSDDIEEVFKNKFEVDCVLSTPIFGDGMRVSGLIEVINKKSGKNPFFTAEDEFVIKSIASMGTLLFNHANVKQNAMKKTDDIKVFLNTASMMSSSELDMGDLISVVMNTAQELVSAERCALFLIDKEKEELWSRLAKGASEIRFPMKLGIAGHVAMTGETLNIPDAYADSRFNRSVDMKTGFRTRNILCVPMRNATGEVIGVTQVINKTPDYTGFIKDDEQQLTSFSALAATTIEKSRVFKALQESLEETSKAKAHLQASLNSSTMAIVTLDSDGRLMNIVHPELLSVNDKNIKSMKLTSYEHWLGAENPTFSDDISKVYQSGAVLTGKNFELRLGVHKWTIHYTICKYKEELVLKKDGSNSSNTNAPAQTPLPTGVSLFIEIIDSEQKIVEALGRIMPPSMVHLATNEENYRKLQGSFDNITLMSANISNFVLLKDILEPQQLVTILNRFYELLSDAVYVNGGIIDKYCDDAGHAIFGLPFSSSHDVEHSVLAALKIKNALSEFNNRLENEGYPPVKVGIGISTGPALNGVVGSGSYLQYSILGDAMNTPRRLQELSRVYGSAVLVCEETRTIVKDLFHTREIDLVSVKGKTGATVAFEIMGTSDKDLAHDTMTTLICYELGLSEYRARNWQAALMHFKKAIALTDDKPSRAFVERCKLYLDGKKETPPLGWDGVWTE